MKLLTIMTLLTLSNAFADDQEHCRNLIRVTQPEVSIRLSDQGPTIFHLLGSFITVAVAEHGEIFEVIEGVAHYAFGASAGAWYRVELADVRAGFDAKWGWVKMGRRL